MAQFMPNSKVKPFSWKNFSAFFVLVILIVIVPLDIAALCLQNGPSGVVITSAGPRKVLRIVGGNHCGKQKNQQLFNKHSLWFFLNFAILVNLLQKQINRKRIII